MDGYHDDAGPSQSVRLESGDALVATPLAVRKLWAEGAGSIQQLTIVDHGQAASALKMKHGRLTIALKRSST